MRPLLYPSGLKPVAWLTERKLIPIMFLNPQQFVLSSKVTLRGGRSDIKLNVRWIMHVGAKTRLYPYISDWLVLWQWGSISAPSLTLHSLLPFDNLLSLHFKKVQRIFLPHPPVLCAGRLIPQVCFKKTVMGLYKDPFAVFHNLILI